MDRFEDHFRALFTQVSWTNNMMRDIQYDLENMMGDLPPLLHVYRTRPPPATFASNPAASYIDLVSATSTCISTADIAKKTTINVTHADFPSTWSPHNRKRDRDEGGIRNRSALTACHRTN
ncbi:hypothetical protein BGZ96_011669 [Linnemannia gamsii]|uniref:Uncharacterized protein n=1 Tax=Linnemannia gamsii TaxID=64522 RepID=A0ABQ7JS72_9FUNG|nr:hypothetical protein BGZ96_011669 [Linnemannia gamsii]